jgi:hypothetical protein
MRKCVAQKSHFRMLEIDSLQSVPFYSQSDTSGTYGNWEATTELHKTFESVTLVQSVPLSCSFPQASKSSLTKK